jgi:hypothetical protein
LTQNNNQCLQKKMLLIYFLQNKNQYVLKIRTNDDRYIVKDRQ